MLFFNLHQKLRPWLHDNAPATNQFLECVCFNKFISYFMHGCWWWFQFFAVTV